MQPHIRLVDVWCLKEKQCDKEDDRSDDSLYQMMWYKTKLVYKKNPLFHKTEYQYGVLNVNNSENRVPV